MPGRPTRFIVALLPDGAVLVRDQLTGLKPGAAVRWGMVTPATPGETGTSDLRLRAGDARLQLKILEPAGPVWALSDTATPKHQWDSANPGTVMVTFTAKAPDSGRLDLAVLLVPSGARQPASREVNLAPPLEWSAPR
jgi:hypothetical protein